VRLLSKKKGKNIKHKSSKSKESKGQNLKFIDKIRLKYQQWKLRVKTLHEERRKKESLRMIVLKFFAAPIIASIGILILYLIMDYNQFLQVGGLMIWYFFPPAGKETVIPIGVGSGIDPLIMGLAIAFIDIFVAIFLLWNYDGAKLIPFLGVWMEKIEKGGRKQFKENKWLEGLAFLGIVLFVIVPFQGSGGVAASIVGRIFGMNKYRVVVAIGIGAVVGCLMIAYLADLFFAFFEQNKVVGTIIAITIIVIVVIYLVRKYLRNKKTEESSDDDGQNGTEENDETNITNKTDEDIVSDNDRDQQKSKKRSKSRKISKK
jgi:hypothetical protein